MAEEITEKFCTLCRNHCSLDNPNCPDVLTDEMIEARKRQAAQANTCQLCKNHCPLDALSCELGRTINSIKNRNRQG